MQKILRGYKLCKGCGQPMLKRGQKRKHPDDYRHASGCPLDPKRKKHPGDNVFEDSACGIYLQ